MIYSIEGQKEAKKKVKRQLRARVPESMRASAGFSQRGRCPKLMEISHK